MRSFAAGAVRIAFLDEGTGREKPYPVVLIHGFASHADMNWVATGWVRELTAAGYRVVAPDNRGHGKSEKLYDPAAYGSAIMAGDVCRLMDHLGIGKAHVIGYSMGARIAARLAIAHPTRVMSVVFGGLGINMVRGMGGTDAIAEALAAPTLDAVESPLGRTFRAFAEQTGSDLAALAACIRSARDPVPAKEVSRIACPVLVAAGTRDAVSGSAHDLAALIPGAEALDIAGREHMKAVGDRKFKAAVLKFLERVEGAAGRAQR